MARDPDIDGMNRHCIKGELMRLRIAIRAHRDARGDDRCWQDDETLYGVLPEGYVPPARDTLVELARCEQYIRCRHNPATVYVSPQRRIEELEAEVLSLQNQILAMVTDRHRLGEE